MPSTNGSTEVRMADVPLGERGTADDGNPLGRIYTRFEDGRVFDAGDPNEDNFETMLRRDGKARQVEQVLTLPPRWADMSVVPQDGDSGEAEFVTEALTTPANAGGMSTPIELVVAQMTSGIVYRRAFFEKVFKVTDDGRVTYDKLAFRPARTCSVIRKGDTRAFGGFRQKVRDADGATHYEDFEPTKAFVYFHGQHRDPLRGASDMETVWSCFEMKQKIRFMWAQFLERNVIPYGVLNTKQGDRAARVAEVAKLKSGGVVGLDEDEKLTPFEAAGSAGDAYQGAMDYLSAEMTQSVVAQFADLASQGSGRGSFALSRDQSDFFLQGRNAVVQEMGWALTNFAAADLVRWNFGPDGKAPQIRFSDLAGHNAEMVKGLFEALAGRPPDPRIPGEFMDYLLELVAEAAGMDVDRVRKAIESRLEQTQAAGGPLAQGIDAAARLVQEAGLGTNGGGASDVAAIVPAI